MTAISATYYNLQPQYDIEHKLRGFEALARMKDENGNFISPGEFIPVAEKVGLIDKVDSMVFRKAAAFFIGCDYVQGYIWGKPMSAEDAEKLVSVWSDRAALKQRKI